MARGNARRVEMRGVWKCAACGNAWRVEMRGVWKCVACGNAWRVEMRGVWKCVACGVHGLCGKGSNMPNDTTVQYSTDSQLL